MAMTVDGEEWKWTRVGEALGMEDLKLGDRWMGR